MPIEHNPNRCPTCGHKLPMPPAERARRAANARWGKGKKTPVIRDTKGAPVPEARGGPMPPGVHAPLLERGCEFVVPRPDPYVDPRAHVLTVDLDLKAPGEGPDPIEVLAETAVAPLVGADDPTPAEFFDMMAVRSELGPLEPCWHESLDWHEAPDGCLLAAARPSSAHWLCKTCGMLIHGKTLLPCPVAHPGHAEPVEEALSTGETSTVVPPEEQGPWAVGGDQTFEEILEDGARFIEGLKARVAANEAAAFPESGVISGPDGVETPIKAGDRIGIDLTSGRAVVTSVPPEPKTPGHLADCGCRLCRGEI